MSITKELVKQLLEAEEKARSRVKCSHCYGRGYLMDHYPLGDDQVSCAKCGGSGIASGISDEALGAIVKAKLRALCESWLKSQEEIDELTDERDEYKKLAQSWMRDYDVLKAKYEPLMLIPSGDRTELERVRLVAAKQAIDNRFEIVEQRTRAEKAESQLTQSTTANENNIEKLNQTQEALEKVCDALFSTKALAVISTAKEEGSSVVKEWANELDYTRHTLMSDLIIQDARKKK